MFFTIIDSPFCSNKNRKVFMSRSCFFACFTLFSCILLFYVFTIYAKNSNHRNLPPTGGIQILKDPIKSNGKNSMQGSIKILRKVDSSYDQVWQIESKVKKQDWDFIGEWHVDRLLKKGDVILLTFMARTDYTASESGQSNVEIGFELEGLWKKSIEFKKNMNP